MEQKSLDKIEHIEQIVIGLASDLKIHAQVQEVTTKATNENIAKLSKDIREQKVHFDSLIERNRDHFDERINTCHKEIHNVLKEEYVTKAEINSIQSRLILDQTKERVKDIEAAKKDILTRMRNYGAIVSGTIILIFIILGYIFGLK